jgi:hypothetical protein
MASLPHHFFGHALRGLSPSLVRVTIFKCKWQKRLVFLNGAVVAKGGSYLISEIKGKKLKCQ